MKRHSVLCLALVGFALLCSTGLRPAHADNSATDPAPVLKTAKSVPVQYYLSLPHGWRPDREWPVLVTIEGSGHGFCANCGWFITARNDRPYIIVTPCVSSNGRDPADKQAVIAIEREVQQAYHGAPKFFLTGFSAGGHVTWQLVFEHPELLAGAVLSSGNFIGRGIGAISQAPERVNLPIHGIYGEHDILVLYQKQWPNGKQLAHDHGYRNITEEVVPNGDHNPYPAQVLAFCDKVRGK